jgi:YARHG domain
MEFPLSARTFALLSLMGASLGASAPANAQTIDEQQKVVIEIIISTAHSLCYDVSPDSHTKAEGVKGDVKAQLTGLAAKIADIGLTGAGDITDNETQGVLQADLATALKDSAACKIHVLDALASKLLSPQPAPPPKSAPPPTNGAPRTDVSAPVAVTEAPPAPANAAPPPNLTVAPASPASMSCDELWHERNAVYARNGYCFKTQKAIAAFGKSCFSPYGELQGSEKNRVTEIRIWEQQKGCK